MIDKQTIIEGAEIDRSTRIGPFTFIGNKVIIGKNCEIQNNVSIMSGTNIKDEVFIGANVTITNTRRPKANKNPEAISACGKVNIQFGASIGAGAVILCGNTNRPLDIGENSTVGAGAVITKSVPANTTVIGNPAGVLITDVNGSSFVVSMDQYYVKKIKR